MYPRVNYVIDMENPWFPPKKPPNNVFVFSTSILVYPKDIYGVCLKILEVGDTHRYCNHSTRDNYDTPLGLGVIYIYIFSAKPMATMGYITYITI